MARLQWIGGPTVLLQLGGSRILTDPMFGEGPQAFIMSGHPSTGEERAHIARKTPLPPIDTDILDLVIVSHLHTDHFDSVAVNRLNKSLQIVAPEDQVQRLRDWGFRNVSGLSWGAARSVKGRGIEVRAVPAEHSADPEVNRDLGTVNGYLISYSDEGRSGAIYWTGDTVWFDGLADIKTLTGSVDLLIVHLGAVGDGGPWGRMTMNSIEGARLVELFQPKTVIPIHHNTFSHYVEPVEPFVKAVEHADGVTRTVVLPEGQQFDW